VSPAKFLMESAMTMLRGALSDSGESGSWKRLSSSGDDILRELGSRGLQLDMEVAEAWAFSFTIILERLLLTVLVVEGVKGGVASSPQLLLLDGAVRRKLERL
jgi:hypothetical protein